MVRRKAWSAYQRLLAERYSPTTLSGLRDKSGDDFPALTIDELLLRYLDFARGYYVNGEKPSKELTCMKEAMGHLRALYATDLANDFGPKKLKAVRQHMIDACNLSRNVVNKRVGRIKRIFKWAVSEELVAPSVFEGLRTVVGLRRGRTAARETDPVKPVPDPWVDAILANVSPQIAAMIELQRLTGMRPRKSR